MENDTGSVSPFTGEVVAQAFESAQAVVVLLTPDDEARLHEELRRPEEPDYEVQLTAQPRQNVLLEAGMALGYQPTRTIFVELGHLRPISDLAGRNVIRLDGTVQGLHALAGRLEAKARATRTERIRLMAPPSRVRGVEAWKPTPGPGRRYPTTGGGGRPIQTRGHSLKWVSPRA